MTWQLYILMSHRHPRDFYTGRGAESVHKVDDDASLAKRRRSLDGIIADNALHDG